MPYTSQVTDLQGRVTATTGELNALDALILTLDAASITSLIKELHIPVGASVSDAAQRLIYKSGSPAATLPGGSTWSTSTGLAVTGAVLSAWTTADVAATSFAYSAGVSGVSWSTGTSIAGAQDEADPYCYDWAGAVADKVVGNTLLYAGREASSTGESQIHNAGVRGLLLVSGLASTNFVMRDSEVLSHSPIAWATFGTTESFQLPKRAGTLHCSHVSTGLTLAQARILSDALRTCCAALSAGRALPAARATRIVWEGDSLTYATRVSGLPYAAPLYAQVGTSRSWGPDDAEQIEYGYPGQQLANMLAGTQIGPARADIDLTHRTGTPRTKRIHVLWLNTNDNIVGTSAATMKANLDTRVGQIKAEGGIPIVIGMVIRYAVSGVNQAGFETRAAAYHAAIAADTGYITAPTTWDGTKKAYFVALHTIVALQNELDTSGGSATRYVDGVSSTIHLTETGYGHIVSPLSAAIDAAITPIIPAITSANNTTKTQGVAFTFAVTASGSPTSFAQTGALPAGVSFNTATGVLSGTPTTTGVFVLSITATNGDGTSAAQSFTLTVNEALVPIITSPNSTAAVRNASFAFQPVASRSPTSWTITGLPAGVAYFAATGLIYGIPTATGVSTITITAINSEGSSTPQTFTLTVNEPTPVMSYYENPKNFPKLTGRLYFFPDPAVLTVSIDLGDVEMHKLSINPTDAKVETHRRGQIKTIDRSLVSTDPMFEATLTEEFTGNLELLLFGKRNADVTQAAGTASTAAFADVVPLKTYHLPKFNVSGVIVKVGVAVKVEGTDYQLDAGTGAITILSGGSIVSGDDVDVTYDAPAITFESYSELTNVNRRGFARLIEEDTHGATPRYIREFVCNIMPKEEGDRDGKKYSTNKITIAVNGNITRKVAPR